MCFLGIAQATVGGLGLVPPPLKNRRKTTLLIRFVGHRNHYLDASRCMYNHLDGGYNHLDGGSYQFSSHRWTHRSIGPCLVEGPRRYMTFPHHKRSSLERMRTRIRTAGPQCKTRDLLFLSIDVVRVAIFRSTRTRRWVGTCLVECPKRCGDVSPSQTIISGPFAHKNPHRGPPVQHKVAPSTLCVWQVLGAFEASDGLGRASSKAPSGAETFPHHKRSSPERMRATLRSAGPRSSSFFAGF